MFKEVTVAEWLEMGRNQDRQLDEWERSRKVKQCKCGNHYSFEKGDTDPKECPRCRGAEGDLVL